MTLKDKELLITDICGRLPYGVYIEHTNSGFRARMHDIDVFKTYNKDDTVKDYLCHTSFFGDEVCKIEHFKPYLFPLSSMNEEQKEEYKSFFPMLPRDLITPSLSVKMIDWLNAHHFDYRGLIEKGLAIDATNIDIY